jgi:large subunit ribosomal protein L23
MKDYFRIIKRPVITEKSYRLLNDLPDRKRYVVEISNDASKPLVSRAFSTAFGVKVESVNIINIPGKTKRFKGIYGKRSDRRKAVITLEPGHVVNNLIEGEA